MMAARMPLADLADLLDELERDRLAVGELSAAAAHAPAGEGIATLLGLVEERLEQHCVRLSGGLTHVISHLKAAPERGTSTYRERRCQG
jgi:hypothetical protein